MGIGREDIDYADVDAASWTLRDEATRAFVSAATRTVASLVRSTLGPNGMMSQILTENLQGEPETVCTSNAGEIIDAIERGGGFGHPVAALFFDAVDAIQRGLSDGSTTAILLTDALVNNGINLIEEGVRPGNVVVGYAMAASRAGTVLDSLACEVKVDDRDLLERVAATSMTADLEDMVRRTYAARVTEAVQELAKLGDDLWIDTDDIKVLAGRSGPGGLYRGVVVRRFPGPLDESEKAQQEFDWSMLDPMTDATVALIDREIDFERTATPFGEDRDSGVSIDSFEQWIDYTEGLNRQITTAAENLVDLRIDVLVSQEEIDEGVRTVFETHDIDIIDGVKYPRIDIYRLAKATGGTVVDDLDELTTDRLGIAGSITEYRVGDEKWTFFDDCEGSVFTLVVDAETETASEEHEHVLEDALEVTATAAVDRQVLPGAGAPAMAVATDLREYATTVSDIEQLAIEAFADALESIPAALTENAGANYIDTLTALRAAHSRREAPTSVGISADGELIDAWEDGVVEPRRVFSQSIETANAIAEQLLTMDAVIYPNVDLGTFRPQPERE